MVIQFNESHDLKILDEILDKYQKDDTIKGILILLADGNNYPFIEVNKILQNTNKPIFGGVFPSLIYDSKKYDKGFILVGFTTDVHIASIENMHDTKINFDFVLTEKTKDYLYKETIMVFVDGFTKHISKLIDSLFMVFGLEYNFIGGGAGSLSLQQKPCIITNNGLKEDCAVIAGIDSLSGVGVKHGWDVLDGPYKITSANANIIYEIEHIPAFEFYKKIIEKQICKILEPTNFFEIAKGFPFGIMKLDSENIVRDPVMVDEKGNLVCVGEIETGNFVNILKGEKDMLVKAAARTIKDSIQNRKTPPKNMFLIIDCISRSLFLEEYFTQELDAIKRNTMGLPLVGALTIGEIANNKKEYLEFYNKTCVIGCF